MIPYNMYYYAVLVIKMGSLKATVKSVLKPFVCPFKNNSGKKRFLGAATDTEASLEAIKNAEKIGIVAVKHTAFVAELLKENLLALGVDCEIYLKEPKKYEDIPYIMICPQNFKVFPKNFIAFQMEQTVNSRWLTDEYMEILYNAQAVFDYSMVNIEFFSKDEKLKDKLFYLPIDVSKEKLNNVKTQQEKTLDLIFYGDPYIERRKEFLDKIGAKFNLKVISNTFGQGLYNEMKRAKIIVNIHYYENALLETTRLYEALSNSDCLIISEKSCDTNADQNLENIVDFTPVGDIDFMLSRIEYWLNNNEERQKKASDNLQLLKNRNCETYNLLSLFFDNKT